MKIRKTTEARVALLEIFVVFYAFAAGAADPSAFTRIAIPTIVISLVLLLRNASSGSRERTATAPLLDIAMSFGAVIVSQAVLALVRPEFLLPPYRFTRGALVAWGFLVVLRAWFPHRFRASRAVEAQTPVTMEQLHRNAMELEGKARQWSNRGNLLAAAAIGLFALSLPFAGERHVQLASGIFIAGAAYVGWIIRKRGTPAPAPLGGDWKHYTQYSREELQRQSVLLNRLWHCYFGAVIPGVLLLLQGATLYGYFVVPYVLLVGELNYRAIEWIHLQLTRINRPDNPQPEELIAVTQTSEAG
jgi:hypothetical protein